MPPKRKGKEATAKVEEKKPKLDSFVAARRQSSRQSTVKAQELIKKQSRADSTDEDLEESDDDFVLPEEEDEKKSSAGAVVQPVDSFLSSESSSGEEEEEEEEVVQPKKVAKPRAKRAPKKSEPPRVVAPKFKKNYSVVSDRCVLSSDSDGDFEDVIVPKSKSTPVTVTQSDSESDMEDVQENEANLHELFPLLTQKEPEQDAKKETHKKKVNKASKSAMMDVSQLLAMGETQEPVASTSKPKTKKSISKKKAKPVASDESDWEEVEHGEVHRIPKEGVEVKIEGPNNLKKKKSKTMDMEAIIKRRINQIRREKQIEMHKASLLCHLSHGMIVNRNLNSMTVMAVALSILPSQQCYPPKQTDIAYVEKMTSWFKKKVSVVESKEDQNMSLVQIVEQSFTTLKAPSKKVLVFMFVAMLRSLGIKSRLVISLQPLALKLASAEMLSSNVKPEPKEEDKKKKSEPKKPSPKEEKSSKKNEKAPPAKETKSKQPSKPSSSKSKVEKPAPKSKRTKKETESKYFSQGSSSSSPDVGQKLKSLRARKGGKYKEESSEDSEIEILTPKKKKSVTQLKIDDEDDFKPEVLKVVKNSKISVKDRRALSTDSERADSPKSTKTLKKKVGNDFWVEVFVEMEEKWISVDVINGKVHCVELLHSKASTPILYIMGFGQDESVRDVTRRYCPQFHTTTRKQRVEQDWWDEATVPFYGKKTAFDKEEEEDMNKQLQDRPVPKTLSELKNHPLYVLKRHLLKFEGIYPPEAPPLGFFKDEPIYARECVFTLRSRETWVKEAKVVKLKETPYKVVKARPKYDRMSGLMMDSQPLEIFGPWQTEDYVAPPAENGKVPRNEYGNVELFKACMLPKGAVHLQVSSLNKTAKKLGIDCAPAMVGFDYHCGGCHPVYDGFVVCEEFKDILLDAHREEEEERLKRGEEKRLKRIYGNWRRLVHALMIREKLLKKYDFSNSKSKKKNASTETASTSKMLNGTEKKVSSKASK